jgi:hypothetical protein
MRLKHFEQMVRIQLGITDEAADKKSEDKRALASQWQNANDRVFGFVDRRCEVLVVLYGCRLLRHSGNAQDSFSATLARRSAKARSMTPPSDVRRPPSNAAVIFLRPTAGNEKGRTVVSFMVSVAAMMGWIPKILRHLTGLRHAASLPATPRE